MKKATSSKKSMSKDKRERFSTSLGAGFAYKTWFTGLSLVWAVYVAMVYMTPITQQSLDRYETTESSLRLISLSLTPISFMLWALLTYASLSVLRYAAKIKGEAESAAYSSIGQGLMLIVSGLIIGSFSGTLRGYMQISSSEYIATTVASNLITALIGLLSFYYVLKGSKALVETAGAAQETRTKSWLGVLFGLLCGSAFVYLIFQNPYRTMSPDPSLPATYYLSDAMIILWVALPTIIGWIFASLALVHLDVYGKHVSGIIYKRFVKRFTLGMGCVLTLSILLQFLTQNSEYFASVGLNAILVIIFFILLAYALAYLVVASAARKLHKIEEV